MEFKFKKFTLVQSNQVFKFGTDASLLGALVPIENSNTVLEIGTGTGVISLMMAQRDFKANFTAIDFSIDSFHLATENVSNSLFNSSIDVIHSSLQDFNPSVKFDSIVSNPPFFIDSTKSPSELKNNTRHTDSLSISDLFIHSKRLLKKNGTFTIVYPSRYEKDLWNESEKVGLYPTQLTRIRNSANKEVKRVIVTFSCIKGEIQEKELTIKGDHNGYSETVFNLLQPFLLKL